MKMVPSESLLLNPDDGGLPHCRHIAAALPPRRRRMDMAYHMVKKSAPSTHTLRSMLSHTPACTARKSKRGELKMMLSHTPASAKRPCSSRWGIFHEKPQSKLRIVFRTLNVTDRAARAWKVRK